MNNINCNLRLKKDNFSLNLNIDINNFSILGVYGPSGSGKTTLLRLIAGLDYNKNNIIEFNNIFFQNNSSNINVEKRNIGLIFQNNNLFPHLNVKQNLLISFKFNKQKVDSVHLSKIVKLFNLNDLLEKRISKLSGGQKRLVAIARALINKPKLLLLDEPLSGIDQKFKKIIQNYLVFVNREFKIPSIIVSHQVNELKNICSHILIINKGNLSNVGLTQNIITKYFPEEEIRIETTIFKQDKFKTYLTYNSKEIIIDKIEGKIGDKFSLLI